ncbi:MAG: rhodanese-related sulfurtransferase [Chlamydiia bacterium]|nr:rhodanese-related sulfurtransferase [Chlamydiia bacterium]
MDYLVLAFYALTEIEEPHREIKRWKRFLNEKEAMGRIYINEKGVNAQMSISEKDAPSFYEWFLGDSRYKGTEIKVHHYPEQAFPKMTVKYREQLAAMDRDYDVSKGGKHVSSKEWAKMIEERDADTIILDVRNDYEWDVGHFEGTERPELKTFREFPKYAEELGKKLDKKKTKVMMYCTGGIRCELYSCLFTEQGFDQVYQLDGGIIKYGLEEGNKHWKGNLFVFDDRLVVPISDKEKNEVISTCVFCEEKVDTYYNCANMDCNELFLSCRPCAEKMRGCCQESCKTAKRVRPLEPCNRPKPFRKLPYEEKLKFRDSSSCQSAQSPRPSES